MELKVIRPDSLTEIVGNNNIKEAINVALSSSIQRNDSFPHTLLYGPSGTGKTSLANVIARERGGDFKTFLSNMFRDEKDIQNMCATLNADGHEDSSTEEEMGFTIVGKIRPTTIFLDEIHQLKTRAQEALLQVLEDNIFSRDKKNHLNGQIDKVSFWVPKFTLIGATTKPGNLDKAFLQRFKLIFTLNTYSIEELFIILDNYTKKVQININDAALYEIAKRSRGIARKAINFLERSRDTAIFEKANEINEEIVDKTFKLLDVDGRGLESIDIDILRYLYSIYPQKIGLNRLASVINITEEALREIVEPYLLRQGFVTATASGRLISECGMLYLEKQHLIKIDKVERRSRKVTADK